MALKCIIIDDEQYSIDALSKYVGNMDNLEIHSTYTDPFDALLGIAKEAGVDFIFLDVEMPGMNGVELAKQIRNKCRYLVFTTGHASYAIDAFSVRADQYLLKPVTMKNFAIAVTDLIAADLRVNTKNSIEPKRLSLKTNQKNTYRFVNENEIIVAVADRNYVSLFTSAEKKEITVHMGISHFMDVLDKELFLRINKSTIISKRYIKESHGDDIIMLDGRIFKVGSTYREKFRGFLLAK